MRWQWIFVVTLAFTTTASASCVNPSNTCGSSQTAYLNMCRLPPGCKNPDYASNLENALITIDQKFAPTTLLQGHGHRGTNGDGPKLDSSTALDCSNSPSTGQLLSWNGTQCTWAAAGAGSGDVIGPGSATDRSIPVYNGPTGTSLADSTGWFIDSSQVLYNTTSGTLGIGTTTPQAVIDIRKSGAASTHTHAFFSDTTTNAADAQTKFNQFVTDGGAGGWTGANSLSVGTFWDIGGSDVQGNNIAAWANNGDVIVTSGRVGIGTTIPPAYRLEIDSPSAATDPFGLIVSGTRATSAVGAAITNSATGGSGSNLKYGLAVNNSGSFTGVNAGITANITGGTLANKALVSFAGGITSLEGGLEIATSTSEKAAVIECTGNPSTCVATQSSANTTGGVTTETITATNTHSGAGSAVGLQISATGSNATAIAATTTSDSGNGMTFNVTGSASGSGSTGMVLNVNGGGHTGTDTGLKVDVTNTTDAEAIRTINGGVFLGAVGTEGFSYSNTTKHTLLNGGATPATNAALEVDSDANDTAIQQTCTDTTGSTCSTITLNGAAGTNIGQTIAVAGTGASDNVGLTISAGGGSGLQYAMNTSAGDVGLGAVAVAEGFHYNDTNKQTILGVSNGIATDVAGNTLEVHAAADKTGVRLFSSGAGLGVFSETTGATTVLSTANAFSNTETSSTNAINKAALAVGSTGTWNGTGSVNAGVTSSATGGTLNYAFDALAGGIRTDTVLLKPQGSAPFTCAAAHEGMIAYATTSKLVCVCSDSDGGTFEWEAIEDRTVTCTF